MKNKMAFYIRLSKEDGDNIESESIKNQRDILNSFLKSFHESFEYIDEYVDDGYSGSNFNRPAWKKLIEDINNKKINTIITKDLSRMGRDYICMGEYIERIFPENNIRFIAINDDIDTLKETPGLEFLQFKLVFNDYYLKDTSKKIRRVLKNKKERGKFLGKKAVYGYKKDKNDKYHLVIDKKVKNNVILIFNLIAKGYSISNVCSVLKEKRIQNPDSYIKGINKYDWCYKTIEEMIKNETYIGNITQGKRKKINYKSKKEIRIPIKDWIVVNNTHKPIISKELFIKSNEMLRRKKYIRNTNSYILKGLIRCSNCNHLMTMMFINNRRYVCCSRYLSCKKCVSNTINYDDLEIIVVKNINKLLRKYCLDKKNIDYLIKEKKFELIDKVSISKNKKIEIFYRFKV